MIGREGTKNHPAPGLPGVNLLSESAFDRLAVRTLKRRFAVAGAALVVLIGLATAMLHLRVNAAEREVAAEQVQTGQLVHQTQTLAPLRTFFAGVTAQEQTVETTMAGALATSDVLAALRDAAPAGLQLESIALAAAAPPVAGAPAAPTTACAGPDPFDTQPVIGCITLTGTALDRAQVGEFVLKLADARVFVEPFITTTTTSDTTDVSFSGSVGISQEAVGKRFATPDPAAAGTGATS